MEETPKQRGGKRQPSVHSDVHSTRSSRSSSSQARSVGSSAYHDSRGRNAAAAGGGVGFAGRFLSCFRGSKASGQRAVVYEVADSHRKLGDVYEVMGAVISGPRDRDVLHKCRHKQSNASLVVRTITKPSADERRRGSKSEPWKDIVTEITIMKQMQHPNIIAVVDVFEDVGHVHVVTEQCAGLGIFDPILVADRYTEKQAAIIIEQVVLAVDFLHKKYIAHRNLRPEAFQYATRSPSLEGNALKLTDLSTARFCKPGRAAWGKEKLDRGYFVAPEVLSGSGYNVQCDMWSVGLLLYALLSGLYPFQGEDESEVIQKICVGTYTLHLADWKNVSSEAKELVRQLMIVDPNERLTAAQLKKESWVKEHAGSKVNILASGTDSELAVRLRGMFGSKRSALGKLREEPQSEKPSHMLRSGGSPQGSTLHVITESVREEQIVELREKFQEMQGTVWINEAGLKALLKEVGLKDYRLDPTRVAQDAKGGEGAGSEFVPASATEWEQRSRRDAALTAFHHARGASADNMILPGQIKRLTKGSLSRNGTLINPLTMEIVAWMDRDEPKVDDLRKLVALLRGNSYY